MPETSRGRVSSDKSFYLGYILEHENEPEAVETGRRPRASWPSVMRPERLERTKLAFNARLPREQKRSRAGCEGRSKAASVLVPRAK